jgi:DNA-binding transcriptional ArsR family regulator
MDINIATTSFSALSQPIRLQTLRLLIKAGADGIVSGDIGAALDIKQNTMSTNLMILHQAGLVRKQREGRSIRYFADISGLRGLLSFLMEDCCGGQPEACQSLLDTVIWDMA